MIFQVNRMPMPHSQAGPGMPMMRGQAPIYSMNPSPNMVQGNSPGGQMMMPAQSPMGPTGHFVPSPQNPNVPSPQRMGMAPSPSQTSIRTPGSHNQSHNPEHQQTDEYLEKVRQLGKYIEPLRKMIAKIGNEDQEKLQKMKKLMDILSNPSKRLAYDVLLRCESVLEHMIRDGPPDSQQDQGSGGSSSINPILDSVLKLKNQKFANVHSSLLNHSLHSTFGPPLEAINGPEITISPPTKRRKRPLVDQPDELPDHIQVLIKDMSSVSMYVKAYKKIGMDEKIVPFGQIRLENVMQAKAMLKELKDLCRLKDEWMTKRNKRTENEEMMEEANEGLHTTLEKIAQKSSEYFYLMPSGSHEFTQLPILDNEQVLKREEERVLNMLEFETAERLLLAAQYRKDELHPLDYIFQALETRMELLDGEKDAEAVHILRYIYRSRGCSQKDVSAIYRYAARRRGALTQKYFIPFSPSLSKD